MPMQTLTTMMKNAEHYEHMNMSKTISADDDNDKMQKNGIDDKRRNEIKKYE